MLQEYTEVKKGESKQVVTEACEKKRCGREMTDIAGGAKSISVVNERGLWMDVMYGREKRSGRIDPTPLVTSSLNIEHELLGVGNSNCPFFVNLIAMFTLAGLLRQPYRIG